MADFSKSTPASSREEAGEDNAGQENFCRGYKARARNRDRKLCEFVRQTQAWSAEEHWAVFRERGHRRFAYLSDFFPVPPATRIALRLAGVFLNSRCYHKDAEADGTKDSQAEAARNVFVVSSDKKDEGEAVDPREIVRRLTGQRYGLLSERPPPLGDNDAGARSRNEKAFRAFCDCVETVCSGVRSLVSADSSEEFTEELREIRMQIREIYTQSMVENYDRYDHRLQRVSDAPFRINCNDIAAASEVLFHFWCYVGLQCGIDLVWFDALDEDC